MVQPGSKLDKGMTNWARNRERKIAIGGDYDVWGVRMEDSFPVNLRIISFLRTLVGGILP